MVFNTPTKYYFVTGTSEGYTALNAFDGALLDAKIGNTNLVKMSSILPPRCEEIPAIEQLPYGALVPVAYASMESSGAGEILSSAVAIAYPKDDSKPGLIMEYSARGHKEDAKEIVERMAKEGMIMRNEPLKEIRSVACEHKVEHIGATFAAVVLWN